MKIKAICAVTIFLFLTGINSYAKENEQALEHFTKFISSTDIARMPEEQFKKRFVDFIQLGSNKLSGKGKTGFLVDGSYMFSGCHGRLEVAYFTIKAEFYQKIKRALEKSYQGKPIYGKKGIAFGNCPKISLRNIAIDKETFQVVLYNCLDIC